MNDMTKQRKFMKSDAADWNNIISDQKKKIPCPPIEKPYDENGEIITLPSVNKNVVHKTNIYDIINDRKSRRKYTKDSLTLDELFFSGQPRELKRFRLIGNILSELFLQQEQGMHLKHILR